MLKCYASMASRPTWEAEQTNRTRVDTVSVGTEQGDLLRFFFSKTIGEKIKKIFFETGGLYYSKIKHLATALKPKKNGVMQNHHLGSISTPP